MPEYNPAIAAQIQPPQAPAQPNFGQTLSTIADFQRAQAATDLSRLQALQAQRKYNGLLAASQAMAHGGDPLQAGAQAGADPADINQLLAAGSSQKFMNQHGGLAPAGAEANAAIALKGAETSNARAQLPGIQAKSQQSDMELRGGIAQKLATDTSDDNWKATLPELSGHVSPQGWAQILDAYKNPEKRPQVAKNMIAAALPPADAVKQESTDATSQLSTPLGRLSGTVGNSPPASQAAPPAPIGAATQSNLGTGLSGRAPMSPQAVETSKLDAQQYSKVLSGLQAQANTAASMLPHIDMAKSLINSPDFYSGTAEGPVLAYKRFLAATGIDPGASLPQEAFRKTMAANILNQVDNLKATSQEMGASTSRIFASQIELMEKAAQNPDNSVAANRFLTELSDRAAKRSMTIGDMAADYKKEHGSLDVGFEKDLRNWMAKNPMFTAKELANPQSLAAAPKQSPSSYQEGQTAVNSAGHRVTFTNGRWQ